MNSDPLLNQLCQLAEKLAEKNIRLIVGGGYGLLLKANHITVNFGSIERPRCFSSMSDG
jgi:hypothetical protein